MSIYCLKIPFRTSILCSTSFKKRCFDEITRLPLSCPPASKRSLIFKNLQPIGEPAYVAMTTLSSVPESTLVKEVLSCCQGIDGGQYVRYQGGRELGGFFCVPGTNIPTAQQQLISRVTELGWLLRRVKELSVEAREIGSVVHEALVAACTREVNNCYRLIAILEGQYKRQQTKQMNQQQNLNQKGQQGQEQLTLRRLAVWFAEPQARLRIVAAALETVIKLRGGEVINALYSMSKHGDPLVRKTIGPMLEEACIPYFKGIFQWMSDGVLDLASSPHEEDFMVSRAILQSGNASTATSTNHPAIVWRSGYSLNQSQKPKFMSDVLAQKVLTAGRTVSFLRQFCGDSEWALAIAEDSEHLSALRASATQSMQKENGARAANSTAENLYNQVALLEKAVETIQKTVGSKLLEVIVSKERLFSHISTLQRYILLGQGDFVQTLLDVAGRELDRPAKEISLFSLQGHLQTALTSCAAAQMDEDLQTHVGIRLTRAMDGDKGWDVVALSYTLDGPAAAVLSPEAMSSYSRISRLLWSIKHADAVLENAWHHLNTVGRLLATVRSLEREFGVDALAIVGNVPPLLRFLHAKRSDMAQFVSSLEGKLVFEVMSPAFSRFETLATAAKDLDALVSAHDNLLVSLMDGMFLDQSVGKLGTTSRPSSASSANGDAKGQSTHSKAASASDVHASLKSALRSVLDIYLPIRRLMEAVDLVVRQHLAYFARARDAEVKGTWKEDDPTNSAFKSPSGLKPELLIDIRAGAWRVYSAFDRHVKTFQALLPPDSQLEFWVGAESKK